MSPSLPEYKAAINDDRSVGLVWVVVNVFLRSTTELGVFAHPLSIALAWQLDEAWLEHSIGADAR